MNTPMQSDPWRNFLPGTWREELNLRDFIQKNYRQLGLKTYDLMDCCEN